MHKWVWGVIGTGLWWLLWPVWVVYFRNGPLRSRVLVVCDNEILVVQNWLGNKKYTLPGGGCKKNESPLVSAVRELREETGIVTSESALRKLGSRRHKENSLKYHARFFCLELNQKPELQLHKPEIFAAIWIPIASTDLENEVAYALKRYRPIEQASLL